MVWWFMRPSLQANDDEAMDLDEYRDDDDDDGSVASVASVATAGSSYLPSSRLPSPSASKSDYVLLLPTPIAASALSPASPPRSTRRGGKTPWCLARGALGLPPLALCVAACALAVLGVAYAIWLNPLLFFNRSRAMSLVFEPPYRGRGVDVEPWVESFAPGPAGRSGADVGGREGDGAAAEPEPSAPSAPWKPPDVKVELRRRFTALSVPPEPMFCAPPPRRTAERYAHLRPPPDASGPAKRVFLALNLHTVASLMPTLSDVLVDLAAFLGPDNLYVSIYESGSDDATPQGLAHLAAALTALGVPHSIMSDGFKTDWSRVDRIEQLAVYRNLALTPFVAEDVRRPFEEVVYINDVYLCLSDVLELIHQRRVQGASASCGTDWRETRSYLDEAGLTEPGLVLYDNWVARTLSGQTMRPRLDAWVEWRDGWQEIMEHERGAMAEDWRARWRSGRPVPVYSCWNGVVAFDARPFRNGSAADLPVGPGSNSTAPALQGPVRFRSVPKASWDTECAASECKLLARDFWRKGFRKWIMVPRVAVTYNEGTYHREGLEVGAHRGRPWPSAQDEAIDWSGLQEPEFVVCWPWLPGRHWDFPWNRLFEPPYRR